MVVPKQIVILLSGIPATGKSEFARGLARDHGFAHYDLECYPRGWPRPELKHIWDADRTAFVAAIRRNHDRAALDWGFPVSCLSWVKELRGQDVRLIWFDGDIHRAREAFRKRGGTDLSRFDFQVHEIRQAGYPGSLSSHGLSVIPALSASGAFLKQEQIESLVFQ